MATTITMPQLGETVTEGTVAQWLKKVGDPVEKYEAFVEISTDKVNAEVPSPVSGVISQIIVEAGDTVPTGAPIAIIEESVAASTEPANPAEVPVATPGPGRVPASYGAPANGAPANGAPASGAPSRGAFANGSVSSEAIHGSFAAPTTNGSAASAAARTGQPAAGAGPSAARRMSPAVRRLAREHNVDLESLHGSGDAGRVTAQDVIVAAAQAQANSRPATLARIASSTASETIVRNAAPVTQAPPRANDDASAATLERSTYEKPIAGTLVPLTPARKLIAQRMSESLAAAPHAWTMIEVDVTKLVHWRAREKDRFLRERGYALTLLPFFTRAVVQSLRAHPLLNSRYTNDGIVVERDVHVGIAIAGAANLVVPVIRNADTLSIAGLAIAAGRLIERARSNKLGADELSGGTFTVNNTGANGSILSKPIINGGQAAIVTMEAVVKRPVVIDDAIAIRAMMNVCLSLDHRVLDGASVSGFMKDLKRLLEAMDASATL